MIAAIEKAAIQKIYSIFSIEKATAALLYCDAAVAVRGMAIRALLYGPHISKILCLFGVYSTKTTRSKILNKIHNYRNAEFH